MRSSNQKIVDKELYEEMEKVATRSLCFWTRNGAKKHGLILVDTKNEFGLHDGKLMLIDEIHTPDSSRFWIADTMKKKFHLEKNLKILIKEISATLVCQNAGLSVMVSHGNDHRTGS